MPGDQVTAEQLSTAEYLIIGSSVLYGIFRIKGWLKKNGKKDFCCKTEPDEKHKGITFVRDSVPDANQPQCQVFFLPGRRIHEQPQ